jgi:hypothetical protein
LIYRIVNARRGRAGEKGMWGNEMRRAAASVMSKRFRTVGTLKGGWSGILSKIGRALGLPTKNDGATSVKGGGLTKMAKAGLNPEVSMEYRVTSFQKGHQPYIDPKVRAALEFAFQKEIRSMKAYLLKKLQPREARAGMSKQESMADIRKSLSEII